MRIRTIEGRRTLLSNRKARRCWRNGPSIKKWVTRIRQCVSVEEITGLTQELEKVRAVLAEDDGYCRKQQKHERKEIGIMSTQMLALITGANKGIGFETARRLGLQGMHILLGARDTLRGKEAVEKLATLGIQATLVPLDVSDESSIARAAQLVEETFGRLDILINNVGISGGNADTPSKTSLVTMRAVYDSNVFGTVAVTIAMLPLLRRSQAGRIVNVSSGLGSITQAADRNDQFYHYNNLPYQSSKAAVNAITVEFAKELAGSGIKVNAADPGFTNTDFNNHRGKRSVEQAATVIVRLATLGEDGPTGTFQDENGYIPW